MTDNDPETDPNLADPAPTEFPPEAVKAGWLSQKFFEYDIKFSTTVLDIGLQKLTPLEGVAKLCELHIAFKSEVRKFRGTPDL